ncbi:MAG TPA: MotA/TolQ/ExbB proton channel family protein [Spirochaetota bacterium]
MTKTTIEFIANFGLWLTIVTLLSFSVVNIAVIIERIVFFRRNKASSFHEILIAVRERILESRFSDVAEILRDRNFSAAHIVRSALTYIQTRNGKSIEVLPLELTLDNAVAKERIRIEKHIWSLGTIGAIGPLVGLFGTVLGIMRSFAEIAMRGNSGQGVVEVAAGGIWESLYTTAFGILVAVPALIAYNYFVKRSRVEFEMLDNFSNDVIAIASEYNERKAK